jgi:hypothetical protein
MKLLFKLTLLGFLLPCGFAPTAAADVIVSAGYLNNVGGAPNPANAPTPFDPSPTTTLISSGGAATPHDTGVLLFQNTGSTAVTIDPGLKVQTAFGTFQIWDGSLPFSLGPGKNLVLAETANFNFDGSDSGLGSNPLVSGSVSGTPFSFADTTRAIFGHEDAGGPLETTPYHQFGVIPIAEPAVAPAPVPEPGTLALFGAGIGGLLLVTARRRRRHQAFRRAGPAA